MTGFLLSYVALETKHKLLIDTGDYIIKSLFIFGIDLVVIRESKVGIQSNESLRKKNKKSENAVQRYNYV